MSACGRRGTEQAHGACSAAPSPDHAPEYVYDAFRRRVKKTFDGNSTVFVYDGWRCISEYDNGANVASPDRLFVFGTYLDEVLMMRNAAGTKYYYHTNHLYSVHAVTNQSGAIVEAVQSYDAYGKPTIITGAGTDATWFTGDDVVGSVSAIGNPWFYTGQRLDAETGLMYYKNRYFDTGLGRFISRDPIGYKDGTLLYSYTGAMVSLASDPFGLRKLVRIEYGPWACKKIWSDDCKRRCEAEGYRYLGCVWLLDFVLEGLIIRPTIFAYGGTRQALVQCCCDYPTCSTEETARRRKLWDVYREKLQKKWDTDHPGMWGTENGKRWPGHHVHDLKHGGEPDSPDNVVPVPPDVHKKYNKAYLECYAGHPNWDMPQEAPFLPIVETDYPPYNFGGGGARGAGAGGGW